MVHMNLRSSRSLKIVLIMLVFLLGERICRGQNRCEIALPDIYGYQTLKCDFRLHTVFSDGEVWPTVRVQEAWRQGLDAIAITDQAAGGSYDGSEQPVDRNKAYVIARPLARQMGITLIPGSEIVRPLPQGPLVALFVNNANLLDRKNWTEAVAEAREQNAFLMLTCPEFQKQDMTKDSDFLSGCADSLVQSGQRLGIEVYCGHSFCLLSLSFGWKKGATLMANSAARLPVKMEYPGGEHRPLTLVFASDHSAEAIRRALEAGRTAIFFHDTIIGDEQYLNPLFFNSIQVKTQKVGLRNKELRRVDITNHSDVCNRKSKVQ